MEPKNYKQLLPNITTFIFDVDGVLTNGSVVVTTSGEMLRNMHVKDGYAIKTAVDKGYNICIISGGSNEGVRKRLEGLGVTHIYLGTHKKTEAFYRYIEELSITKDTVLFMGDDIPDIPVMQLVGVAAAPQDAVPEVKAVANYVSHKKGGKGAVRDVIEQVLKVQNQWNTNFDAKYD